MKELHKHQELYKAELAQRDGMVEHLATELQYIKDAMLRQSLAPKMATPPAPASFNGKLDIQDWLFSLYLFFDASRTTF
jgi:hypothetical protein